MSKILAILTLVLMDVSRVAAQTTPGTGSGTETVSSGGLKNPLSVGSLPEFLTAILTGIVRIGTIVLIMMLVYVGFLFVTAQGKAEELSKAKSALVWTVIGGLILLGATAIQQVIQGTVNTVLN